MSINRKKSHPITCYIQATFLKIINPCPILRKPFSASCTQINRFIPLTFNFIIPPKHDLSTFPNKYIHNMPAQINPQHLETNPFLRTNSTKVVQTLLDIERLDADKKNDDVAVFAALREWKNMF